MKPCCLMLLLAVLVLVLEAESRAVRSMRLHVDSRALRLRAELTAARHGSPADIYSHVHNPPALAPLHDTPLRRVKRADTITADAEQAEEQIEEEIEEELAEEEAEEEQEEAELWEALFGEGDSKDTDPKNNSIDSDGESDEGDDDSEADDDDDDSESDEKMFDGDLYNDDFTDFESQYIAGINSYLSEADGAKSGGAQGDDGYSGFWDSMLGMLGFGSTDASTQSDPWRPWGGEEAAQQDFADFDIDGRGFVGVNSAENEDRQSEISVSVVDAARNRKQKLRRRKRSTVT